MNTTRQVALSIPSEAEYVSLARLTASGVANQCGFDIDSIEDIKVCVSEVLSQYISLSDSTKKPITVVFDVSDKLCSITLTSEVVKSELLFTTETGQFAFAILGTLMDEVVLSKEETASVRLTKMRGGLT